ncbi:MAG: hypothetical protein WBP59_01650 [Ilumatobacteraceae bacterium]
MTELTRPVVALLASTFDAPPESMVADIVKLRESLVVALRRCLDAPTATWEQLVERGTVVGEWDDWRVASLSAASNPDEDPEPEVTREALATLTSELIGRRDVLSGPWEGADRQDTVDTPQWQAGRVRRELVFAIEHAMVCADGLDAAGLEAAAARIESNDPDDRIHPGLAESLRRCASDAVADGVLSGATCDALRRSLAGTPFAASVDRIARLR